MLTTNSELYSTLALASQEAYKESPGDILGFTSLDGRSDPDTGFSLAIYRSVSGDEYIFAFRGSEFSSQDIYTDLNAGMKQWSEANRDYVAERLSQYTSGNAGAVIHFTGHSLGGSLAQFAAYEYAVAAMKAETRGESTAPFDLVTFNALGAELALSDPQLYSNGYDASLAETIDAVHFKITGDVISRLGDDHVGGSLLAIDKPVESNFAAHSISRFTGSDGSLRVTSSQYENAVVEDRYLNIAQPLSVSGVYASLGDDGQFSSEEATLRTISAFAFGLANARSDDLSELVGAFFGDPSMIGQDQYDGWVLLGQQVIIALQSTRQLAVGGNLVGAYALALANIIQNSAQLWEDYPELADALGLTIDVFIDLVAKPLTVAARSALDYALENEFAADEYPDVVDYVSNSIEWIGNYFSQQPLNRMYIQGFASDDLLSGDSNYWPGKDPDDYILGYAGDDVLDGGLGTDYLIGGAGADQYIWNFGDGDDAIGDYDDAGDRIIVNGTDLASLQFFRTSLDSPFYIAESNPEITLHYEGNFLTANIGSGMGAGSITVTEYSPASAADFGIVLNEPAVAAPTTDIAVAELGGEQGQTSPSAYYRQQSGQNGLDWTEIALRFNAIAIANYGGGTAFGQIGGAFEGGPLDDYLVGNDLSNALHGLDGDDRIEGGAGDDYLEGWAGSDTLSGGDGVDLLFGGVRFELAAQFGSLTQQDQFYLAQMMDAIEDVNVLDGGPGGDYVSGGAYTDFLEGGSGADYLLGGSGQDYISGGVDADVIYGDSVLGERFEEPSPGAELLLHLEIGFADGSDGVGQYDDVVHAGAGNDIVWGELGDDELHGGAGGDNLIGDRFNDEIYFSNELTPFDGTSPGLDSALHGNDRLFGDAGSDVLVGLGGNDYLAGGTDSDSLLGGTGDDTYFHKRGDGLDYVEDNAGNHTLLFSAVALDDLQVIFQGDQVRVGTGFGAEGFYFSKNEWANTAIALNTPDALIERSRLDTFYLDVAGNLLLTVHGSEALTESDRNDLFSVDSTDSDKPRIVVASGVDEVEIEALTDGGATMRVVSGGVIDLLLELTELQLATGLDFLQLADGPIMSLVGFSGNVLGSTGNDRIIGSGAADTLHGGAGNDLIEGRGGNDTLNGDSGSDVLRGESGNDVLNGGYGSDYLDGGEGNDDLESDNGDTLYFEANDGQDRLTGSELSYLAFGAGVNPDDVVLNYTGTADSTFRIEYGGGSTITSYGTTASYWLRGINVNGADIPLVHRSDLTDGIFRNTRWNDIVETGDGNDTIHVNGWGDDVFRFKAGDGQDTMLVDNGYDPAVMGEIRLGADVDLSTLSFGFANGRATISYGENDQILLDPDTVFSGWDNALSHFTLLSEADPAWVPVIRAGNIGGALSGTFGADHLINSYNGIIVPGYGDDVIEGGEGSDWIFLNDVYIAGQSNIGHKEIWGGGGNELVISPLHQGMTYHYNRGDGLDTIQYDWSYSRAHPYSIAADFALNTVIFQPGGNDALDFGAGITLGDLRFVRFGNHLSISLTGDTGGIRVEDYFHAYQVDPEPWTGAVGDLFGENPNLRPDSLLHPALLAVLPDNPIAQLRFADGSVYDMGSVLAAFLEVSDATLLGTGGNDSLSGTAGDDVIHALGGDDYIEDFGGSNVILAGAGNDEIIVAGNNVIDAGPGDDRVNLVVGNQVAHFGPGSGSDLVIHNVDNNITVIEMAEGLTAADIEVSLTEGEWGEVPVVTLLASGDSITFSPIRYVQALDDFETVPGSETASLRFSDGTVIATSELYSMAGSGGETIVGTKGDDVLTGTDGNDTITGGRGNDFMDGAGGDDVFLIEGRRQGKDRIVGGAGFDTILGGDGDDRIMLTELLVEDEVERIDGGPGVNTIAGSGGRNILDFTGVELFNIATLDGRGGRDTITGSSGNDVIAGSAGNDVLSGGAGNDTYLFSAGDGRDVIRNADTDLYSLDVLRMQDIDHDQLWLTRKRKHLVVNIAGSTDRVLIKNWYGDASDQLDVLYAGNHLLMREQVDQLVNAMAAFDIPEGVGVIIPAETRTELEPLLTSVWQLAS
jgi:Ca2+-binding RTX toxin-like protein